jgi:hypothetical protein
MLSFEAVHERLICELDTAVAVSPAGTVGGLVSDAAEVAIVTTFE